MGRGALLYLLPMKHKWLPVLLLCQGIFKKTATHLVGHLAHHVTLRLSSFLCKIRSWDGCLLFFWQAHLQMRPACLPRQGPVQPSPPASITESRVQRPKGTFVYIQQNAGGCDETSCFFRPRRAGGVTWGLRLCYHPRTTCAQRWVTSLRLHPPHPHLFLVGHKHLSVLPASLACCHLPPAAAAPAWVLPPPSGLGSDPPSSAHAVGHCLPWPPPSLACHPDTPAAPHWGLRDPRPPQGSPFPSSPGHPAVYTQAMLQLPQW